MYQYQLTQTANDICTNKNIFIFFISLNGLGECLHRLPFPFPC